MDARISAAVKVSIACGFIIFLATLLLSSQIGLIFKAPVPSPSPGSTPTPTHDGFGDIFIIGIGPMLAALPILAVGSIAAIRLSRASISSIKGSISVAILTALLSYVAWLVFTALGSLVLGTVPDSGGLSLIMVLLIFLFVGLFAFIVPVLMLLGVISATIAAFIYATYVLKLS